MAGKSEQWQRKADERFMRIEKRLASLAGQLKRIEIILLKLPQLLQEEDRISASEVVSLTVSYRSRYLDTHQAGVHHSSPDSLTSDLRKGFPMKIKIIVNLLAITIMLLASVTVAQEQTTSTNAAVPADTRIPRNSKVYLAPM